jgi:hypothetical protein
VGADNKKKARLNCISHLLSCVDYEHVPYDKPDLGKRRKRRKGVAQEIDFTNAVPDLY